jgi:hypothetical protein
MGLAAAAILVLAGGGHYLATSQPSAPVMAVAPAASAEKAVQERAVQTMPAVQRQQEQAELARLREEAAVRERADQEAAARRQVEEDVRRKIEAEAGEKKRLEEEAKQQADAEARRKAGEDERKVLEADEVAPQWGKVDRQHIQVALVALGYGVSLMNGTLDRGARDKIAAWQKARNEPATGFSLDRSTKRCCRRQHRRYPNSTTSRRSSRRKERRRQQEMYRSIPILFHWKTTGGSSCIWREGRIAKQPQSTSAGSSPIGWTFSSGVAGRRSRPTRPAILPEAFQARGQACTRCW